MKVIFWSFDSFRCYFRFCLRFGSMVGRNMYLLAVLSSSTIFFRSVLDLVARLLCNQVGRYLIIIIKVYRCVEISVFLFFIKSYVIQKKVFWRVYLQVGATDYGKSVVSLLNIVSYTRYKTVRRRFAFTTHFRRQRDTLVWSDVLIHRAHNFYFFLCTYQMSAGRGYG